MHRKHNGTNNTLPFATNDVHLMSCRLQFVYNDFIIKVLLVRECAKFMRNPGGGRRLFLREKRGVKIYLGRKKGGKDFFWEKKKGAGTFFEGKKGG